MIAGITYLIAINLITFILMGYDKSRARKGKRRIPEKRLFLFAAIGGALGGWIGMRSWRHKTQHSAFVIGFPLLFIANAACVYFLLRI